jgi:hypothetical protein
MDCRKFDEKLEDYLEDGLDFAGRFSMERHAQQCFACGKTVADALKLRQMARESRRVKAPADFETQLMHKIQSGGIRRSSWRKWSLPVFTFSWPSWRLFAAGCAAVVFAAFAAVYTARQIGVGTAGGTALVQPKSEPVRSQEENPSGRLLNPDAPAMAANSVAAKPTNLPALTGYSTEADTPVVFSDSSDSEYVECLVPGPGGRQLIMRLPSTIRTRYGQPSEEYFIRNVSH